MGSTDNDIVVEACNSVLFDSTWFITAQPGVAGARAALRRPSVAGCCFRWAR